MRFLGALLFILSFVCLIGCEGDISITYHFTDLKISNNTTQGGEPRHSNSDTIPGELYALRMDLLPQEIKRSKGRYIDYNEAPPYLINQMTKLEITSESDFDDTHPAGTLLNEYFIYYPGSYAHTQELRDTIPFAITQVYLPEFPQMYLPEYAHLLLMTPPTNPGPQVFHTRITYSSSSVYENTTEPVYLP